MATAQKEAGVTIRQLLESGAHFGHQTHRWNPKMKRFIFEARNGIYIIDLAKTLQQLRSAVDVVREVVKKRKSILFVGTKKGIEAKVLPSLHYPLKFVSIDGLKGKNPLEKFITLCLIPISLIQSFFIFG